MMPVILDMTCVCVCVQVVVRLSDELLSQAVMVVESCRPTLTINLAGARQHWLEGMLRHEIGTLPLTCPPHLTHRPDTTG